MSEEWVFDPDGDVTLILTQTKPATGASPELSSQTIRAKTSSRHLALGSPVFRAMLSNKFAEGQQLQKTGHSEVALPEDHAEGMHILLDLVHGQHWNVPKHSSLGTLAEMATIMDKYDMHQVVHLVKDQWLNYAERDVKSSGLQTIIQWLWVCHVFDKPKRTKGYLDQLILQYSNKHDPFKSCRLTALMPDIYEGVQFESSESLAMLCSHLDQLVDNYTSNVKRCGCGVSCDLAVLGGLHRELATINYAPRSQPDGVDGRSVLQMISVMEDLPIKTLCEATEKFCPYGPWAKSQRCSSYGSIYETTLFGSQNHCSIKPGIKAKVAEVRNRLTSMNITKLL